MLQVGPSPDNPIRLATRQLYYCIDEPYQVSIREGGFALIYQSSAVDPELAGFRGVNYLEYGVKAHKASKVKETAMDPYNWVHRWARRKWPEASRWVDPQAQAAVQEWHQGLRHRRQDCGLSGLWFGHRVEAGREELLAAAACEDENGVHSAYVMLRFRSTGVQIESVSPSLLQWFDEPGEVVLSKDAEGVTLPVLESTVLATLPPRFHWRQNETRQVAAEHHRPGGRLCGFRQPHRIPGVIKHWRCRRFEPFGNGNSSRVSITGALSTFRWTWMSVLDAERPPLVTSNLAHLLIVDDDANTLASLARAFRLAGHEATVCDNAARALELVKSQPFDMMLSDVVMPVKDGLTLLEELRNLGVTLPVVMISGQANIEMAVRATRLGAIDFLEKPLSTDKLLLTVDNVLKLKRLEEENRELRQRVGKHEIVHSRRSHAAGDGAGGPRGGQRSPRLHPG